MKIVALAGSIVGSKTRTATQKMVEMLQEKYPQHEVTLLDLADYQLVFSDGRNYFEYEGDTKYVTETIMVRRCNRYWDANIPSIYTSYIKKHL